MLRHPWDASQPEQLLCSPTGGAALGHRCARCVPPVPAAGIMLRQLTVPSCLCSAAWPCRRAIERRAAAADAPGGGNVQRRGGAPAAAAGAAAARRGAQRRGGGRGGRRGGAGAAGPRAAHPGVHQGGGGGGGGAAVVPGAGAAGAADPHQGGACMCRRLQQSGWRGLGLGQTCCRCCWRSPKRCGRSARRAGRGWWEQRLGWGCRGDSGSGICKGRPAGDWQGLSCVLPWMAGPKACGSSRLTTPAAQPSVP